MEKTYTLHQIVKIMKATRVRRTGHVARMGTMRNTYTIYVEKSKHLGVSVEKSKHLGDFGVDGMIILKSILN
jgi:hypothetical protein